MGRLGLAGEAAGTHPSLASAVRAALAWRVADLGPREGAGGTVVNEIQVLCPTVCRKLCYSYRQDCRVMVGPGAEGQMGGTQPMLGWISVDRKEEGAFTSSREGNGHTVGKPEPCSPPSDPSDLHSPLRRFPVL